MARVRGQIEDLVEIDAARELAVGTDELAEVLLFFRGAQGMALHQPVRLVAGKAGIDECEQEPLAEKEAVTRFEVAPHPLGADDQALDEPGEAVEHVIQCEKGVGDDDTLGGGVRDVALVPEGHVLEADDGGCADDACEPADALGDDRVTLVWHRGRAFLALPERLAHLADLGAGEVADLEREAVERGGDHRECGKELRVAVALDDLRRGRSGAEAEPLAGDPLELRVAGGIGADRSRELADADAFESRGEAPASAVELEGPDSELEPERRRLGVNPVRAPDRERVLVL